MPIPTSAFRAAAAKLGRCFHSWSRIKKVNGYSWRFCTHEGCCKKQRLEMCGASDTPVWQYK